MTAGMTECIRWETNQPPFIVLSHREYRMLANFQEGKTK